jgi:hypothetical protein
MRSGLRGGCLQEICVEAGMRPLPGQTRTGEAGSVSAIKEYAR